MSEAPPPTGSPTEHEAQTPAWQKLWQFFASVVRLERSVRALTDKNRRLEEQMLGLQREIDEHKGQLKVLLSFIRSSLHDQIERQTEQAAIRAVERVLSRQGEPPAGPRPRAKKPAKPQE